MGVDSEELFRRVRGEVFSESPVLQAVLAEHGWDFTKRELVGAAHLYKAWQALRARLGPGHVQAAREAGERWALGYDQYVDLLRRVGELPRFRRRVESVEEAIQFLYDLVRDLSDLAPIRFAPVRRTPRQLGRTRFWSFAGPADEARQGLPPELLDELLGVLGQLTADFLAQLEEVGKFELPPILPAPVQVDLRITGVPDPTAGVTGFGRPGLEILETGDLMILTANPAAGAAATVVSPGLHGPSVIERLFWAQDGNLAGDFQLMIQRGGTGYPSGAGPVGISGDSLFVSAAGAGVAGSRVQLGAFVRTGEWWPRRFVPYSGYQLVLTVNNTGAAAGFGAMGVDRRDVRRRRR